MIPRRGEANPAPRIDNPGFRALGAAAIVCLIAGGSTWADPGRGAEAAPPSGSPNPAPVRFGTPAPPPSFGVMGGLSKDPGTDLTWRGTSVEYDARGRLSESLLGDRAPGLLERYRDILMEETVRRQRRNPHVFWADPFEIDNDEDLTMATARHHAERIFGSAHGEILSQMLDHVVEQSEGLSALNTRVRGIDFGIRTQPTDPVAGSTVRPVASRRGDPLRINMIVSNKPRVEFKARMAGGMKANILVPLASPGIRATITRPIFPGVHGSLRAGVEDLGQDVWVAADLRFSF